jgi:hypothetical protein
MNPSEPAPAKPSAFVPLLLIALAFITVETGAVIRDRSQIHALKAQVEQLDHASRAGQDADAKMQSLLSNLLRLAEVDGDAKAIVARHGLRLAPPPPSPGAGR